MVNSRLKYYIDGTAIGIAYNHRMDGIDFTIENSRSTTTPGYIRIPTEDLPRIIEQLTELQNELFAAGKFK